MRKRALNIVARVAALLALQTAAQAAGAADGGTTVRATAGGSEIVITTTPRLAGAIHSLTWGGKEFIDSADHGRQLQSASNFDYGTPITGETFNPTEAGSRRDGAGEKSSSRLLHSHTGPGWRKTARQIAFCFAPCEKSSWKYWRNTTVI